MVSTKERKLSACEQLEESVRKRLGKRFEKFEIKELSRNGVYRSWFCSEPGTWDCSFTITTIPGYLFVTGDLGDLVVARCYDMLPWCRGSVHSTHYFSEKVSSQMETTEFSHEVLREWIDEELKEIRARKEDGEEISDDDEIIELLTEATESGIEDEGEAYFRHKFSEVYDGGDPPSWDMWKHRFLTCREAVRWFVTHHDEPVVVEG